jgi:Flp pilus assembly protein TadD
MSAPAAVSIDAARALERISALLQRGVLADAETECRALLARHPDLAPAVHMLGLIRKDAGDFAEGERLVRRSLQLEPGSSEFRFNLANLLRRAERLGEAEAAYREVLALDPGHFRARLALARTLNDQGQHAAAEAECRLVVTARPADPAGWTSLAMTLRDQGRTPEAESAYRRALAVAPNYPLAHFNLAGLLTGQERSEEALGELDRAAALGIRGFEAAFTRGRVLTQLYRFEEAEAAFAEAAAARPTHPESQLNLARMRFMRGDPRFARTLAEAADRHPDDLRLQMLHADVLRRSGDLAGSEAVLRRLTSQKGELPELRSALATVLQEAGKLKDAEHEALEAAASRPNDVAVIENLVSIQLSLGRWQDAAPFVARQRARAPLDQRWLTYEAMIARLQDDAQYRVLFDYRRLVRSYDLTPPPGWSSMQHFHASLARALAARHKFAKHPFDQSLRNGSQTARDLTREPDPAIQALLRAFLETVARYRGELGTDPDHPMSARNHGEARFAGCWSVELRRGGHHVNHIHPEGWISSAYYVSVPAEANDVNLRSGWLKFGEPRFPVPGAHPELFVPPQPGRLVLFPSYMWHGTNPIHGDEPRLTVAFDIVPAG